MEYMIFILIFFSVLLFFLGFYYVSRYRQSRKDLIKRIDDFAEPTAFEKDREDSGWINKKIKPFFEKLGARFISGKEDDQSRLRLLFVRAGYRRGNAAIFLGIKTVLAFAFIFIAIGLKVFIFSMISPFNFMLLGVALAVVGFYLPNLYLLMKTLDRRERIQKGLPDALDLMVVCVEAGSGLDAAITRVSEEMRLDNKVLSEELRVLTLELRAGKSRKDALTNFALRANLDDVNNLVSLLIQTDRFGTSIAQALRVHSDFMRVKRFQRAEEIAAKMPLKMIFPLVLFIFPFFLLIAAGPAVIGIYRVFTGQ